MSDDPVPAGDPIARCRAEARRLLKDLRSAEPARAQPAARRFQRLRSFAALDPADLPALRERARQKHALAVVADEHGHGSWPELLRALQSPPCWHAPALGGFLFAWFAGHGEGSAARAETNGYLLPFRGQCFVCGADAIAELGVDPADPDWARCGFDLVQPADAAAAARLHDARRRAIARGAREGLRAQAPL